MIKTIALNVVYLAILKLLNHIGGEVTHGEVANTTSINWSTVLLCVFMIYNGLAHFLYISQTTALVRLTNTVYLNTVLFMFTYAENTDPVIKKTYMWVNIVVCMYSIIIISFIGIEDYLRNSDNIVYMEITHAVTDFIRSFIGNNGRAINISFMGLRIYSTQRSIDNLAASNIDASNLDITEDEIESITPVFIFEHNAIAENAEIDKCPVCLENMSGMCRKLKCNHSFHAICIDGWVIKAGHTTCPLCRSSIRT
jgi:hypothetical protein